MNIIPLNGRVLVAERRPETTTASGILIEGVRGLGLTHSAKVLAVGSDVTDVSVDDEIYLDWSKASPVKIDGLQRAIVKHEDILAVVEK